MNSDLASLLAQQLPWALMLVYFQNWLKAQSWFPLLTYESKRMNHYFSIVMSGLTTLGITITHTGNPMTGGTVIISLPSMAALVSGLGHWLTQYIMTKTAYTALQSQLNPPSQQQPTPVVVMPASKPLAENKPA
jgi:hypothetical protein